MTPEELGELKLQLKELKDARRSGAKRVVFGDRDVTYKSDDEMRQAQRELEIEIGNEEGNLLPGRPRRRSRSIVAVMRRG